MKQRGICICLVVFLSSPVLAQPAFELGPPLKIVGCEVNPSLLINPLGEMPVLGECVSGVMETAAATAASQATASVTAFKDQVIQGKDDLIANLQSNIQQFANPAIQALANAPSNQLHTCLANRGVNMGSVVLSVGADPLAFIQGRIEELWGEAFLAAGRGEYNTTPVDRAGNPKSVAQRILQAEEAFGVLASKDPLGACVWELSVPFREGAKNLALTVFPTVDAAFQQAVDGIVKPMLNIRLEELLRPLFISLRQGVAQTATNVQSASRKGAQVVGKGAQVAAQAIIPVIVPTYVQDSVYGIAKDYLLDSKDMQNLARDINLLAQLVASRSAQMSAQQEKVERLLEKVSSFTDKQAAEVMIEVMRLQGHAIIDEQGPGIINLGISAIHGIKDASINTITGISGGVWEPTDGIAEFVTGIIAWLIDAGTPVAEAGLIAGAHYSLDAMLDKARLAIRLGQAPSEYATNAGPLGELLRYFPSENDLVLYASPELKRLKNDLFGYHHAVLNLSKAIVHPAPTAKNRPKRR